MKRLRCWLFGHRKWAWERPFYVCKRCEEKLWC